MNSSLNHGFVNSHCICLAGRQRLQDIQPQKRHHQRISSAKQNSRRQLKARVDQAAGRLVSSKFYFAYSFGYSSRES